MPRSSDTFLNVSAISDRLFILRACPKYGSSLRAAQNKKSAPNTYGAAGPNGPTRLAASFNTPKNYHVEFRPEPQPSRRERKRQQPKPTFQQESKPPPLGPHPLDLIALHRLRRSPWMMPLGAFPRERVEHVLQAVPSKTKVRPADFYAHELAARSGSAEGIPVQPLDHQHTAT